MQSLSVHVCVCIKTACDKLLVRSTESGGTSLDLDTHSTCYMPHITAPMHVAVAHSPSFVLLFCL